MSQDIVANGLNMMMNALKARKNTVIVPAYSKVLLSILAIAKLRGYVKHYKIEGRMLHIEMGNIHGCQAIKPRYAVKSEDYNKYCKRYLPTVAIGMLIVSTNQGIMTHTTAEEKKIGGSLLAYMY